VENMTIILGVVMFTVVVIGLVAIILAARSKLVSSGESLLAVS
jgi:Na+-transporting NADH:ubiquinone oxidoreductase subunit F